MTRPHVGSSTYARPKSVLKGGGRGLLMRVKSVFTVTPKISVTDDFTDLDNFVTLLGEPDLTSGMLGGSGVVRHKTQALTDSHKVSGVIGSLNQGKMRLVCCANINFTRYYALEIGKGLISNLSIIKGNAASSVEARGILGFFLDLLFALLSIFSPDTTKFETTNVDLDVSDVVAVWYDEATSTIRTSINDIETACTLAVPRGEVPHGEGYRWHGVAQGIDGPFTPGVNMTSYACEDI
jgi:hypothetical protein